MVKDFYRHYIFEGNHREVGLQHGEALRESIQMHLELVFDLAAKKSNVQKNQALEIAGLFMPYISKYAPGFLEEAEGLAKGACITINEAVLLQVRQEVVNLARCGGDFECTSYAITPEYTVDGKMYTGQNADLAGDFESFTNVVTFSVRQKPKIMMVVPAGQLSYNGISSEGIGVDANFLRCSGWKKGFPRYLITRLAAEQTTFEAACAKIESLEERASSRNILVSDYMGNIANYEITATDWTCIKGEGFFVHSNHFIDRRMSSLHEMNTEEEMQNSIQRKNRLEELIQNNKGKISVKMIKSFLRDHENGNNSICAHEYANGVYHTFTSLISNLTDLEIVVAKGTPCKSEYATYEIQKGEGFAMKDDRIKWPDGNKCAVLFTIHVDGESLYNKGSVAYPRSISYGRYGPSRAVDRLLDLTDRKNIPCTFFVPGQIADRYPDMMKKIVSFGHEVGFHGYNHEASMYTDLPVEGWMEIIKRSQDTFDRVIGKTAVGYCATACDFEENAMPIWYEMGFQYSSSMRGDDRPYRVEIDGKASDFIEVPARWELDDYPLFAYNFYPQYPKGQDRISSYKGVFDNWRREFDGYYKYGLCMVFMLHPQIIGIPGRFQLLSELMDYMKSCPDVWFATGKQISDWWRKNY